MLQKKISFRKKEGIWRQKHLFWNALAINCFAHSIAEDLGWRGYVLEPLLEKWGKLRASLIKGFLWLLWYLPLFFRSYLPDSKGLWNSFLELDAAALFSFNNFPVGL